jgi:hypothetical protein
MWRYFTKNTRFYCWHDLAQFRKLAYEIALRFCAFSYVEARGTKKKRFTTKRTSATFFEPVGLETSMWDVTKEQYKSRFLSEL